MSVKRMVAPLKTNLCLIFNMFNGSLQNSLLAVRKYAYYFKRLADADSSGHPQFLRELCGNMDERFQLFEVTPPKSHLLRVTVLQAHDVQTKKFVSKETLVDKASNLVNEREPDPYILLNIPDVMNGRKQTRIINNQSDPFWNETFEFYVDADRTNLLEIALMDADYIADDSLAIQTYDLSTIPLNKEISSTLTFGEKTLVELRFYRSVDDASPSLRLSPDLCAEENAFLLQRKNHVFQALRRLLGEENGPKSIDEVPCIAILGSGGGFRAMVGLSGAVKALHSSGVLDCVTYFAGISGSAWYISTLFSHPDFPKTFTPIELVNELKLSIDQSPFGLLRPQRIYKYLEEIVEKRNAGHLVSFTDFFSLMLRDTLLKTRPEARLSHQRTAVEDGAAPLPLYAGIHVKKNVQARVYHEWAEFTPFEVGLPKYGTFMKNELFGSGFFLGRLRLQFSEFPLHYLLGIWGSAFAVLFRQLLWMNERDKMNVFALDSITTKKEEALQRQVDEYTISDDEEGEDQSSRYISYKRNLTKTCIRATARILQEMRGNRSLPYSRLIHNAIQMNTKTPIRCISNIKSSANISTAQRVPLNIIHDIGQEKSRAGSSKIHGMFHTTVEAMHASEFLNTISGRAASIYNPMRGLQLKPLFKESEQKTTTSDDEETFKGLHEPLSTTAQSLYMVDGGLALNSPYPLLLRPQRKVQLYISFDFSSRLKDQAPPFKDILLAAEWAKKVGLPFPPIQEIIQEKYSSGPVQEYYVFQHPDDRDCPVIVHFVLVNDKFRDFKTPGVARHLPEDKKMANFSIFEDFGNPFSLFNFRYSHERFEQLSQLMEFNTLLGIDVIEQLIAELIDPKQSSSPPRATTEVEGPSSNGLLRGLLNFLWHPIRRFVPSNKVGITKDRAK